MSYGEETLDGAQGLIVALLKKNGPLTSKQIGQGTGFIMPLVHIVLKRMCMTGVAHNMGSCKYTLGPRTAATMNSVERRRAERIAAGAPVKLTEAEFALWKTDPEAARAAQRERRNRPPGQRIPRYRPTVPLPTPPVNVADLLAKNAATYGRTTVFAPGFEAGLWK